VLEFLEHVGQTVRPSEMANLGYHHVPDKYMHLVQMVDGMEEALTRIKGESYVFDSAG